MKKLLGGNIKSIVLYGVAVIVGLYIIFSGLISAKSFFAPLVTALILSLIILPFTKKMDRVMNKTVSAVLSTIILVVGSLVLVVLIFFQIRNFTESWPKIEESMKPKIEKFKSYTIKNTPLTETDFKDFQEQITTSESGISIRNTGKKVTGVLMSVINFIGVYLLTFIYVFFLLRYRTKFKNFLLRISASDQRDKLKGVLSKSSEVTTQYIQGKLILIGILSVVYSIGLGISGVSNYILVSIIAALLTIIPYIGNIIGFAMALAFGYLTTGNPMTLLGITITFVVSQFLESYILQPFVVGDKVNVHPFFVIVAVILGNFMWGIIGMILAIPVLAIITVVFKNIEQLRPLGVLLSTDKFNEESQS